MDLLFTLAYELLQQPMFARKLTSGCPNIDQILDGGFPLFGITQISGESGCGKTQIGLQLALTCQYPEELGGLGAGVIYISTEDTFPANRLAELISNIPYDLDTSGFSDNVFVKHIYEGVCCRFQNFKKLLLIFVFLNFRIYFQSVFKNFLNFCLKNILGY